MKVNKHILTSKTFWMAIVTVVAPVFPQLETFVSENPQAVLSGLGVAFAILRYFTKGKVVIKP